MTSKINPKEIIKEFIDSLLNNKKDGKFEIVSIDKINAVEIIDEYPVDFAVDINKLYDLTMPKPVVEEAPKQKPQKKMVSISAIFFTIFILVVVAFFFFNPEVIFGKDKKYVCSRSYSHDKLPALVTEEVSLVFTGRGKISTIAVAETYAFTDTSYYREFKDKSYFYQYFKEGDTYKFIDEKYTYRLFSKIDTTSDFFLPTTESDLISHYQKENYICKVVEINE